MLSSVLNSDRAIRVNIAIMRTFVKLRAMVIDNAVLAHRPLFGVREISRDFLVDFMFQLDHEECNNLKSQIVTSNAEKRRGSVKSLTSWCAARSLTCRPSHASLLGGL